MLILRDLLDSLSAKDARGRNDQRKYASDTFKTLSIALFIAIGLDLFREADERALDMSTMPLALVISVAFAIFGITLAGRREPEE
ncbi:MAG: hypothetical protein AAGH48_05450 [Pseudomonadota bacterium]